jgi:uncharacterized membrane protein YphA (DoxX/SURF4 family)
MNTALWVAQGLLAIVFLMAGTMKVMRSKEDVIKQMATLENFSASTIKTIGILEVLGAIGVVLPLATGILPWLTPIAAVGLILTMIGAAITHARRGEFPYIGANAVLLLLAAFVAYGRF